MFAGSVIRAGSLPGVKTGDFGRKGGPLISNEKRGSARSAQLNLSLVGSHQFGYHLRCDRGPGTEGLWRVHCASISGTSKVEEDIDGKGPGQGNGDGKGNGGGGGGGGKGDSSGGDSESSGLNPGVVAILAETGRSVSSFPAEFSKALMEGKVSENLLKRYLSLEKNFITGLLMGIAGFRERLLADPSFLFKVGVECGIGIFTKSTAEYKKREDAFWHELDFVLANVIMAILADFCLVWLPAPTLKFSGAAKTAAAGSKWMKNVPENAFQVMQPGTTPFSIWQRGFAIMRNGAKLFAVGVGSSGVGVAVTNSLIWARERMDPKFVNENPPQDVALMAGAYGVYMAISSNMRYQVLAGIVEERGIEKFLGGSPQVCKILTFIARTGNTYLGSLLWVDFLRLTGLQKKIATEDKDEQNKRKSR